MFSLSVLDTISSQSFDVDDQRPAGVKFNRNAPLRPLDFVEDIISQQVTVNPGIEITEIINYELANVRYRIAINTAGSPLLTDSYLYWSGPFTNNFTFAQDGNVTTVSGIQNVEDWNCLRQFQWNLPTNYSSCPCWFLEVSILYYDEASDEERSVDWMVYDPDNYYFAQLTSSFTSVTNGVKAKFATAHFSSAFSPQCVALMAESLEAHITSTSSMIATGDKNPVNMFVTTDFYAQPYDFTKAQSILSAQTSITTSFDVLVLMSSNMSSTVQSNCINRRIRHGYSFSTATVTASIIPTEHEFFSNWIPRTYLSNTPNSIFESNTPYMTEYNMTSGTYTITLYVNDGELSSSDNTDYSYFEISKTGTASQINAWLPSVKYYPDKGFSSSTTLFVGIVRSGSWSRSSSVSMTYAGAGTITDTVYTITNSGTWTPSLYDQKYATNMSYAVIGGGGGGGAVAYTGSTVTSWGGGGGGGEVKFIYNQAISEPSYTVTVGAGGLQGGRSLVSGSHYIGTLGTSGGTSTFNGTSSLGGLPGYPGTDSGYGAGGSSGNGNLGAPVGPLYGSYGTTVSGGGGGSGGAGGTNGSVYYNLWGGVGLSGTGHLSSIGGGGGGLAYTYPLPDNFVQSSSPGAGGNAANAPLHANDGIAGAVIIVTHS